MTQLLNNTQPTIGSNHVYEASAVDALNVRVSVLKPPPVLVAEAHLSADKIRLEKLTRHKNLFAVLAVLALITALVFGLFGMAWEPSTSLFFALLGIAVVFMMKIRDAKR